MSDAYGVRPGEVSAPLPESFDAGLYFVGRIRTPWTRREDCPKNAREANADCTVELDPRWKAALAGLETCTRLIVLYWMDQARRDLVFQVPAHYGTGRGTFALRSPARPNPVGLHVARLVSIDAAEGMLVLEAIDALDGTPVIDVKPYFASVDSVPEATVQPAGI